MSMALLLGVGVSWNKLRASDKPTSLFYRRYSMTELWIALVLIWFPTERLVDKEFNSEKECWDYYEIETNGVSVGESKFGSQHLTHQNRRPDKNFHFKLNWNYPIRTYKGKEKGYRSQVWLSCEPKYAKIYNE